MLSASEVCVGMWIHDTSGYIEWIDGVVYTYIWLPEAMFLPLGYIDLCRGDDFFLHGNDFGASAAQYGRCSDEPIRDVYYFTMLFSIRVVFSSASLWMALLQNFGEGVDMDGVEAVVWLCLRRQSMASLWAS